MLRLIALAAALLAGLPAQAQLPEPVTRLLAEQGMTADAVSAVVLRGDTALLSHQANRPMQPASTMKVLTTLVSLEQLGPAFRGRTELRTTGKLEQGTLQGDLVLRGGADADFSGEVLSTMLRSLVQGGVQRIAGNLVLDRSLFQPARSDLGLAPFDEAPDAYYNVIPDALLLNKNMLQLDLRSTDKGLRLDMQPALAGVSLRANLRLVEADCAQWEALWKPPQAVRSGNTLQVVLQGSYPVNCARSTSINVLERDDYIDALFRHTWKQLGGTFNGKTVTGSTPPDARLLAEHRARALPEIVRDTNKTSDNALARTLFLSLGALEADPLLGSRALPPLKPASPDGSTGGSMDARTDGSTGASLAGSAPPNTAARADGVVRAWLRTHGIDDTGLVIENGSGLSRTERISANQLGALLRVGLRSNWAPEFMASLPIAATDGTLRRRLAESPASGRARLKTGTLRNVVAAAGYVPDANGVQHVVVVLVNDARAGEGRGRAIVDALVDWVARSGATAPSPFSGQ